MAAIDASPKYLLTDIPAANPDVESVVAFPDHADRAFPGGERVKAVSYTHLTLPTNREG